MAGSFFPHTFENAEAFLAAGRNKVDRPLQSNTRLVRIDADTIGVKLHSTVVVAYHRDGTQTLDTGGWRTVTTADRIRTYSAARQYSVRGQWMLSHESDGVSPPKIQKCRGRGCKATPDAPLGKILTPHTCYLSPWGPGGCHGGHYGYDAAGSYGLTPCEHGKNNAHATAPCEHGSLVSHPLPSTLEDCWRCKGTGEADYGSKSLAYEWDGSPVKIDATGKVIGPAQKLYAKLAPHGAPKPALGVMVKPAVGVIDGNTVIAGLKGAIPGLQAQVTCPVTGCNQHARCEEVAQRVIHLNDRHGWTREQIADWLDTLSVDLRFQSAS